MASVYKSLSKASGQAPQAPSNGVKKNKQRVLVLSSRGVTYRSVLLAKHWLMIQVFLDDCIR